VLERDLVVDAAQVGLAVGRDDGELLHRLADVEEFGDQAGLHLVGRLLRNGRRREGQN